MDSSRSKYEQIIEHLKNEINRGIYDPGDKLPSEKMLCDYYKVSRITVRQALSQLESEGVIFKKQGLGAFVREKAKPKNLVQLTDFSEDMRRSGLESSSKLIRFDKVDAIEKVNVILGIPPDKKLMRLDRVRLANNTPVAYDITWMPMSYGHLLLDQDLEFKTIYEVLEDEFSIPIIAGRYSITASIANEYFAEHLKMDVGAPLLQIDRCSRTTGNKKVYYQKRFNNPRYINYEIELLRDEKDESSNSKDGLPLKEFIPKFKF